MGLPTWHSTVRRKRVRGSSEGGRSLVATVVNMSHFSHYPSCCKGASRKSEFCRGGTLPLLTGAHQRDRLIHIFEQLVTLCHLRPISVGCQAAFFFTLCRAERSIVRFLFFLKTGGRKRNPAAVPHCLTLSSLASLRFELFPNLVFVGKRLKRVCISKTEMLLMWK